MLRYMSATGLYQEYFPNLTFHSARCEYTRILVYTSIYKNSNVQFSTVHRIMVENTYRRPSNEEGAFGMIFFVEHASELWKYTVQSKKM